MRIHWIISLLVGATLCGQTAPEFAGRDPRYRIQPTDVLEVTYRYTPQFNQTVTVQPDGHVALQIVGDLKLQGQTIDEGKAAILKAAAARLRDPEITLVLKEFEKPYFVVGGEVANPGRFEMRGSLSAVEAIAMAGGFKASSAKHSQVVLFHKVGTDLGRTKLLDLKAAMRDPNSEPNLMLQPGDVLLVPQNTISKIERFVKWGNLGVYWNPIPQ